MRLLAALTTLIAGLSTGGLGASAQAPPALEAALEVCTGAGPLAARRATLRAAGFPPIPPEGVEGAVLRLAPTEIARRAPGDAGAARLGSAYELGPRAMAAWLSGDPGPGTTRALLAGPQGAEALTIFMRQFADDRFVQVTCFLAATPAPPLRFDAPTIAAIADNSFVVIPQQQRQAEGWTVDADVTLFNGERMAEARDDAPFMAVAFVSTASRRIR